MADFTPAGNVFVYPTRGDAATGVGFGVVPYKGSYHSELQLGRLLSALAHDNFVVSGLAVPASSASLVLAIPLGVAVIDGRVVSIPGSTNVTCQASTTNYGFLKLEKDASGYVTSAIIEVNVTGTAPADSVALFTAAAAASTVTSTVDVRPIGAPRGTRNRMAVYSAAGTYNFVPEYSGAHLAILIGGGGGGGGGLGRLNTTTNYPSGGGGGGGACTVGQVDMVAGQAFELIVGAGGGNSSFLLGTGQPGNASSLGSLSASGGSAGGRAVAPTTKGPGGAGGAASTWTGQSVSFAGVAGDDGQNASGGADLAGGDGGDAPFWRGLLGAAGTASGHNDGALAGAGGSGGHGDYASGVGAGISNYTTGGAGAPGLVVVFW